ncbi:DUF3667 domain-containing protein [Lichenicola sp.]|uniref:DUF3667 domain-containing protein n=1 Tax=Lichenicola sp. TaxID=2804529 RepID=UPI003AFFD6A4
MSVDPHCRQAAPSGDTEPGACLNCGTTLVGAWCHACGQEGGPVHRSLLHLAAELLETLTHADSRFWRSMRRLVFDPARLTNDYLAGRRAREIPPLRLFLVMLFLLFSIGSLTNATPHIGAIPADAHQKAMVEIQSITLGGHPWATQWLRAHVAGAIDHPNDVLAVMRDWAERFTFLMLPIAGGLLWLLYLPQRRFSAYDHTIFAIHSLSFAILVLIAIALADMLVGFDVEVLLLLLPVVHLFRHMRGVYGSGVAGTLFRMALLGMGSMIAFTGLVIALTAVALQLGLAKGG